MFGHSQHVSAHTLGYERGFMSLCVTRKPYYTRWQNGNTLASHLGDRGSVPGPTSSGKAGSCLPLVGSLQYRTNYMYWFPLPVKLPVVICPVQCGKGRKINKFYTYCTVT